MQPGRRRPQSHNVPLWPVQVLRPAGMGQKGGAMRLGWTAAVVAGALLPVGVAAAGAVGRGWFYEFGGASISFLESATISAGGSKISGAGASLNDDVIHR